MKKTLDHYIAHNYTEIRTYTEYFLTKYRINMDADVVINNSYLNCIDIKDDTTNEGEVKSYLFNTIKKQILWSTSVSHNQERVRADDIDIHNHFDDGQDLDDKIREEMQYQNHKSCVEIYKRGMTDRIKVIIFEAYFDKGFSTARAMAKYFDIPVTSAHYFIRDIKLDLKKIKDEN